MKMQKTIAIGPLTLVGELAGSHVHVTVLGAGEAGQRPLCGRITVAVAEWDALAASMREMDPIRSVLGDWAWSDIVEDGVHQDCYERAVDAVSRAMAEVEKARKEH
jgi:hypothetical protein